MQGPRGNVSHARSYAFLVTSINVLLRTAFLPGVTDACGRLARALILAHHRQTDRLLKLAFLLENIVFIHRGC